MFSTIGELSPSLIHALNKTSARNRNPVVFRFEQCFSARMTAMSRMSKNSMSSCSFILNTTHSEITRNQGTTNPALKVVTCGAHHVIHETSG